MRVGEFTERLGGNATWGRPQANMETLTWKCRPEFAALLEAAAHELMAGVRLRRVGSDVVRQPVLQVALRRPWDGTDRLLREVMLVWKDWSVYLTPQAVLEAARHPML